MEMAAVLGFLFLPSFTVQFLTHPPSQAAILHPSIASWITRGTADLGAIALLAFLVWQSPDGELFPKIRLVAKRDIPTSLLLMATAAACLGLSWLLYAAAHPGKSWGMIGFHHDRMLGEIAMTVAGTAISVVYQELLMRWYLITRLEQLRLSGFAALVISAVVFGSRHFYEGLTGFFASLLWGFATGFAFQRTRSMIPLFISHFAWNTFVFLFWHVSASRL